MVAKAVARLADPEVRAKLESLPHPSPFLAKLGKTLADYADSRLGANSQTTLRAQINVAYEIQRAIDGGTSGELLDAAREAKAKALLSSGDRVFSRAVPGKQGRVVAISSEGVTVKWNSGEETLHSALSLAPFPE